MRSLIGDGKEFRMVVWFWVKFLEWVVWYLEMIWWYWGKFLKVGDCGEWDVRL